MNSAITATTLVQLPRLSAMEAQVLATQLLTEASRHGAGKEGFPVSIERSRKRLQGASVTLGEALVPAAPANVDTQIKRRADRTLDGAWGATFDWLGGWCRLPEKFNPLRAEGQALMAQLFPDALAFTKLPYKLEWQESQARLEAVARDGHEQLFQKLGGEGFLAHLQEAHAAYGEVLHITAPRPDPQAASRLQERREAVLAALRDYVNKVVAHGDPEEAGSEVLARELLQPLTEWESRRKQEPSPPEPPAPQE